MYLETCFVYSDVALHRCTFIHPFSFHLFFFQPDFPSHIVKENKAIVYRPMMHEGGGRYQQNLFWDPRKPKRQFLAMLDIYFFFYLKKIFSRTLHLFTLFDTDQNRPNSVYRLSMAAD